MSDDQGQGGTPPGDTAPDIWIFSPEQASKQLAEMKAAFDGPPPSATPSAPSEARLRLATLGRDFLNRLEQGDVKTREEFDALTTMAADDKDPVAALIAGQPAPNEVKVAGATTSREMAVAIAQLREEGISDGQLHQLLTDKPCTPEEIAAVGRLQASLHGTAEWVAKLLAGDAEARREQLLMSMVLLQRAA
jgi:BMFP domain-containing protein YqiC